MIKLVAKMDLRSLADWKLIKKGSKKRALKAAGAAYMVLHRERIRKGERVDGGRFAQYSPTYLERKHRAGRLTRSSWWRLSGQLMRSQKLRIKKAGKYLFAWIGYEGMQARVRFTDPARAASFRRMSRSKRGAFEPYWRKKVRRENVTRGKGKLTVNLDRGNMVASAAVAEHVDRKRPAIGMNAKDREGIRKAFGKAVELEKQRT